MSVKKFRWSQVYESSEEELTSLLQSRSIVGQRIHADASDQPSEQRAESTTTMWCAEGSFAVNAGATKVSMQPGDALRLEAGTTYVVMPGRANRAYYLTH